MVYLRLPHPCLRIGGRWISGFPGSIGFHLLIGLRQYFDGQVEKWNAASLVAGYPLELV